MSESQSLPKRAKSFAIVGAHFRPPAKALLACLPAGAGLLLVAEPDNPYDAHAVQVWVNAQAYPDEIWPELVLQSTGYGYDEDQLREGAAGNHPEGFDGRGWWHIGYIPAQKAGKNGEPEAEADIDYAQGHIPHSGAEGKLTFDQAGKPMVTVSPWPPAAARHS